MPSAMSTQLHDVRVSDVNTEWILSSNDSWWVSDKIRLGAYVTTYRRRGECAYTMNRGGCGNVHPIRIFGTCVRIRNDIIFGMSTDERPL